MKREVVRKMVWDWVKTRQTKYGAYSAVYVLVTIAILVAANYLANRYNETFDATRNKLYSLADQTEKILDNLDRDLTIYYFDRSTDFGAARSSLVRYENASSRVSVDYIDPDSKPEMAQLMNIRTYGTVLVEVGGNREEASSSEEEDVTNAIIKVLKGEDKNACILTGHGEADTDDTDRDGFSGAQQAIQDANYETQVVSLQQEVEVPSDCTLVILPGPEADYLPPAVETLKRYVEGGGRALIMIDPDNSPELTGMVAGWGIRVRDETVVDFSPVGQFFGMGPLSPLVADYEDHPITDVMGNTASFFPMSRGVDAGDAVSGWNVEELFSTTAGAFATAELKVEDGELIRNPAAEREGPITLAVAATHDVPSDTTGSEESSGDNEADAEDIGSAPDETDEKESRVVVVGSSRFARNYALSRGGNLDLFLNMMNWLSSDEDLISIRPKDPENTPLDLSQAQVSRLFWINVIGLPLVIVIFGVRVWWMRR